MGNQFNGTSIINQNRLYDVPEGTMILKEGEINLDMYKIVSGHVEMYTGYGTENEVLIGVLGPGECFGEFGILTEKPAIYTIIAYSNTRLFRVTEGLMGEFIRENEEDILKLMSNMATNMMRMQRQLNMLSEELTQIEKQPLEKRKIESRQLENLQKENLKSYVLDPKRARTPQVSRDGGQGMRFVNRKKD